MATAEYQIRREALEQEIRQMEREYANELRTARSTFEQKSITDKYKARVSPVLELLAALETTRLLNEADDLGIEVPDNDKWWAYELVDGKKHQLHLTKFGLVHTAKLVRQERFARMEQVVKLALTVITALTGLLGVLIGLIAIRKK